MTDNELKLIRDKCVLFNYFLLQNITLPPALVDIKHQTIHLIEEAYHKRDTKVLKAADAEVDEQVTRHMPVQLSIEFEKLLKEKLGLDFLGLKRVRRK